MDLIEIKAAIRAILMALGRSATEKEFRSEFFNQEGESFNSVLRQFRMTFFEFLKSIPDVCRVYKLSDNDIFVEKVSHKDSKHMDALTVVKKKKRTPPSMFSYRPSSYVPMRVNFNTPSGKPHARHIMPQKPKMQAPYANRQSQQQTSQALKMAPMPQKTVKQSFDQFKKEKAKLLSSLPLAPHMLAKEMVYKGESNDVKVVTKVIANPFAGALKVMEDKACLKTKAGTQMRSLGDSKPNGDIHEKNVKNERCLSDERCWNPFKAALNDIVLQKKTDEMQSLPLRDIRNVATEKAKKVMVPTRYQTISFEPNITSQALCGIKNVATEKVKSVVVPTPNYQTISFVPNTTSSAVIEQTAAIKRISTARSKIDSIERLEAEIKRQKDEIRLLKLTLSSKKSNGSVMPEKIRIASSTVSIPYPEVKELKGIKTIAVTLVEIISPSQFVFQFNHKELQVLATEMNLYYIGLNSALKIPRKALSAGLTVAMLYEGNWHRVEIIYISDSDARVHFVDIGCNRKAKVTDFYYLTDEFASATRKACKGCLFGVKPPGTNSLWSTDAIMAFMTKTRGQKILATVKAVTDKTFELSLIYDGMQNLTVEEYLLDRKLAQPSCVNNPTMNAILF